MIVVRARRNPFVIRSLLRIFRLLVAQGATSTRRNPFVIRSLLRMILQRSIPLLPVDVAIPSLSGHSFG